MTTYEVDVTLTVKAADAEAATHIVSRAMDSFIATVSILQPSITDAYVGQVSEV